MNTFNEWNHHECDCKRVVVMEGPYSVYGFVKNETNYFYCKANYDWEKREKTHCKHNKKDEFEGSIMCYDCGEILENLHIRKVPVNKVKISAKEKQYNKKMKEMFPNLYFPEGNVLMKDIEKRFKLKKEPGDRFPTIKNIIHFILTKHEMIDLANTITLFKSNIFQDLMEKLFKEDIPKSDMEMFKICLNKIRDQNNTSK